MKITHIFKTFFPDTQGGLEEAIRQIGKFSIKNEIRVNVEYISRKPGKYDIDGIKATSYKHNFGPDSTPFSWQLFKNFKRIVKRTDVVQLHFPFPQGELLTLLFNISKPMVVTFHCDIGKWRLLRFFYLPLIRLIFRKVNVIVPTSENLRDSTKILAPFKDKCNVIHLWLDESRFVDLPKPSEDFIQQVNGLSDYCLFVGVLRWYKGLHNLIQSAKTVDGNVVIVGKGPLFQDLKDVIEKEKIQNVFLLGYQSDSNVKYLLENCRFVVLPSISPAEAFGQILLEASYFKKPMITTELGTGTSYVNINDLTGYVVKPNDIQSLSSRMNTLFSYDEKCKHFGINAFKRYKENFTEESEGEKYIELYKKLKT